MEGITAADLSEDTGLLLDSFVLDPCTDWSGRFVLGAAEDAFIAFRSRTNRQRYGVLLFCSLSSLYHVAAAMEESFPVWYALAALFFLEAVLLSVFYIWPPAWARAFTRGLIGDGKAADVCPLPYHTAVCGELLSNLSTVLHSLQLAGLFVSRRDRAGMSCMRDDQFCPPYEVIAGFSGLQFYFARPRSLRWFVPLTSIAVASSLVGGFSVGYDAVSLVLQQLLHAVMLTAAGLSVMAEERVDRRRFVELMCVLARQRCLQEQQAAIDSLAEASLPPWVLARVHARAAALMRGYGAQTPSLLVDTSADTGVAVVGIADFGHWTTTLMPSAVVVVLHRLFTRIDMVAHRMGLTKVAAAGDVYAAVLALEAAPGAAEAQATLQALVAFAQSAVDVVHGATPDPPSLRRPPAQEEPELMTLHEDGGRSHSAKSLLSSVGDSSSHATADVTDAALFANACLGLRAGVAVGMLTGQLALDAAALRYVVGGEALDTAMAALAVAGRGQVCVAPCMAPAPTMPGDVGQELPAPPAMRDLQHDVLEAILAGDEAVPPEADTTFSPFLLRFADPDVTVKANAAEDAAMRSVVPLTSLAVAITVGAVLAITVVQGVLPDHLGAAYPDGLDPAPIVLLGFSTATFAVRALLHHRTAWAQLSVFVLVDTVCAAAALAAWALAFWYLDRSLPSLNTAYVMFFLALQSNLFLRLPVWVLSAGLSLLALFSFVVVRLWYNGRFEGWVGSNVASVAAAVIVLPVMHYLARRQMRDLFVASSRAAVFAAEVHQRGVLQARLVQLLLPPHAADELAALNDPLVDRLAPVAHRHWRGVVTVVGRFVPTPETAAGPARAEWAAATASRWMCLVQALRALCPGGELQLVESFGEGFMLAGPFPPGGGDSGGPATGAAAHRAVAVVRFLAATPGLCVQAAMTVGTAHTALLGDRLMSYRLFGPGVREAHALLDASAQPLGAFALASPAFRRAFRGADVAPLPPCLVTVASAPFSHAVYRSYLLADSGTARPPLPVASDVGADGDEVFGPPLRWRLRAAGVVMVAVVRLAQAWRPLITHTLTGSHSP